MRQILKDEIDEIKAQGRWRQMREIESPQGRYLTINSRQMLNFCSNDYLGLANDERIKRAAISAIEKWGFGSGASRLICGNSSVMTELEKCLAQMKQTEAALVLNSGFAANSGLIPAIVGRNDTVLSDRLNHASIMDGIILSRCKMIRYHHVDMEDLERGLKAASGRRLIVTDTVFSMDGDVAPLKELMQLAKQYEAMVMVDEAHAFGLWGENGSGLCAHLGLKPDVQMGTLSKAAGCLGGFVAGDALWRDLLVNKMRTLIYTTGLTACHAVAAMEAIKIIEQAHQERQYVHELADDLRCRLKSKGYQVLNSQSLIIPVVVKQDEEALRLSRALWDKGVFVSAIRPPTVPENTARLRITVTAKHRPEDLDVLMDALIKSS